MRFMKFQEEFTVINVLLTILFSFLHVILDIFHALQGISFSGQVEYCVVPLVVFGDTLAHYFEQPVFGKEFTSTPILMIYHQLSHFLNCVVRILLFDHVLYGHVSRPVLFTFWRQNPFHFCFTIRHSSSPTIWKAAIIWKPVISLLWTTLSFLKHLAVLHISVCIFLMILHVLQDMLHVVQQVSVLAEEGDDVVPLVVLGEALADDLVQPAGGQVLVGLPALEAELVLHGGDVCLAAALLEEVLQRVHPAHVLPPVRPQDVLAAARSRGGANLPTRGHRLIGLPVISPLGCLFAQIDLEFFHFLHIVLVVIFGGHHEVYGSFVRLKDLPFS